METRSMTARTPAWAVVLGLSVLLASCAEDSVGPPDARIVEGVDLDALFADPSDAEIADARAEWASRSPGPADITIESDDVITSGALSLRVRVVSHDVEGVRHYGAVVHSVGLVGPAPVIVYAHGGDGGTSVEEVVLLFSFAGGLAAEAVWVIPSFRSEPIGFAGNSWTSEGPPSPWDRDVDDALSLLDVALAIEPAADPGAVAVLGFSRGAGVGMLMGIRDPRIDRVVEFFGPTDFFDVFVQEIVEEALVGTLRSLPGVAVLNELYIQPLKRGEMTIAQVRRALIVRSAVLHAELLPALQVHHGTSDGVVAVSQAESLIDVMAALGRSEPEFESFLYPGGGHNPLTLSGSIPQAVDFLSVLLPAVAAND